MSEHNGLRDFLLDRSQRAAAAILERLQGITEEEFMWEPVDGCWSVRRLRDSAGTSPMADHLLAAGSDAEWFSDEAWDGKTFVTFDPSPFTTIAWRLVHLGSCKVMYHEHAFGERRDLWAELTGKHTVADAIAMFEDGQGRLIGALQDLDDADITKTVLTNWGEEWPAWRIFSAMAEHDLQHGAEIGCIRDLYAHR